MTERVRVVHPEGGEVRTKQADAASSDINGLISRFTASGVVPPAGSLRYGDFSTGGDFLDAAMRVQEAEEQFRALPTAVRKYCRNDPGEFLDLATNPERVGELLELGLAVEAVPNGVQEVEAASAANVEAKASDGAKAPEKV